MLGLCGWVMNIETLAWCWRRSLVLSALVIITGCHNVPSNRHQVARNIAATTQMSEHDLAAGRFVFRTYQRRLEPSTPVVRIYIEGDGLAWLDKHRQSPDPTPTDPIALRLAGQDSFGNVVFLARPCQYTGAKIEDSKYWSTDRFSLEIVQAMNRCVDEIKQSYQAEHVELVGYSGGAAIAILLASRRNDVIHIRTVAGNLDTEAFCSLHGVDPLSGSLNPADVAADVAAIPQRHFVGTNDRIVPLEIAESYRRKSGAGSIVLIEGVAHEQGWEKQWSTLLKAKEIRREDSHEALRGNGFESDRARARLQLRRPAISEGVEHPRKRTWIDCSRNSNGDRPC